MSSTGWVSLPDTFPWPPKNGQVVSSFDVGSFDIRWDDPATLADGKATLLVQAQGTILVRGTPKTQIDANGFYRFVAPVPVNSVVIIANKRFVAVNGPRQPGWNNFQVDLPTLQDVAADFADAVNDINNTMDGLVIATTDGIQVNLTPMWDGADGNTISLETSTDSIVRSGSTLLNGQDADFLTFGGVLTLTAVTGPRTPGGSDFSVDGNNFDIANSIRDAINDPANLIVSIVTATAQYGQVVLTATPRGELGNAVSLFTSDRLVMQLSNGYLEGGVGDENCQGITNAGWNIVGVNIYRSDNGERGPYIRLNQYPVSSFFYRDNTDNVYIENETVPWSSWISKGDSPNNRAWTMRTFLRPIVKRTESHIDGLANNLVAIPANAPDDVKVMINGQKAAIDSVFGPTGEITLINRPYFDPVTEKLIPPVLPSEDASVSVSYYYNRNRVDSTLDRTNQIFYRLTTVALDPSSPTGYKETPLGYSPPLSPAHVETIDYIWKQGVRRNRWILEQGGERVKLFKRKVSGVPCPCRLDEKTLEWNKQPDQRCLTCFGTSWVGGYDGPIDIIIAPDDAERNVMQTNYGRKLEHQYEVWTGPSPAITQRDFIVKQTNERYSIGPVRRPAVRGLPLQQHFNIGYLDTVDIRYRVPINGTSALPWPETRYTDPSTPCNDVAPYTVGFDYQATPMETEDPGIPDSRELRGRTPVWENIMNRGGKGR